MTGHAPSKAEQETINMLRARLNDPDLQVSSDARFGLAAALPFQRTLNELLMKVNSGDALIAVCSAGCSSIANMIAIMVRQLIVRGVPPADAENFVSGRVSEASSNILEMWRRTGDGPLPYGVDAQGNEVAFDYRKMMSGGGEP